MKRIRSFALAVAAVCLSVLGAEEGVARKTYTNPVIMQTTPDPTVIRAEDGFFYLYGTEDTYNVPIYRSRNLVDWTFVGTAFTDATRPKCVKPYTQGMIGLPTLIISTANMCSTIP